MLSESEIIEKIAIETGKKKDEIIGLIGEKKKKFAGLLTDQGAAYLIAKELEIDLGKRNFVKIIELGENKDDINIIARIRHIFPPKSFEKGSKKGVLCNFIIEDETGQCNAIAWHNKVAELMKIEKGDTVLLQKAYVNFYNKKPTVNIGYAGTILKKQDVELELPKFDNIKKIIELEETMKDVDVIVRILSIFPPRVYEQDGIKKNVVNCIIADETKTIRAVAWNEVANKMIRLNSNDVIKIEGAYVKQGLTDLELHLGWRARIIENYNAKLPSFEKLIERNLVEKQISELSSSDNLVKIKGTIFNVNRVTHYDACPLCYKKVQIENEDIYCESCGKVKPIKIPIVALAIDDGSANIECVFFRKLAHQIIINSGKNINDIEKESFLEELKEIILEKNIEIIGTLNESAFMGELRVNAKTFKLY